MYTDPVLGDVKTIYYCTFVSASLFDGSKEKLIITWNYRQGLRLPQCRTTFRSRELSRTAAVGALLGGGLGRELLLGSWVLEFDRGVCARKGGYSDNL